MTTPSTVPGIQGYPINIIRSAIVRPLRQPLFDCEMYDREKVIWIKDEEFRLRFFVRPIGDKFQYSDRPKTRLDTNLISSKRMIDRHEFSIFQFKIFVDQSATQQDRDAISQGCAEFLLNGRSCLCVPLCRFPQLLPSDDFTRLISDYDDFRAMVALNIPNEMAQKEIVDSFTNDYTSRFRQGYKFTIGKSALKIAVDEFEFRLCYHEPPTLSRPLKISAFIDGVYFFPQ